MGISLAIVAAAQAAVVASPYESPVQTPIAGVKVRWNQGGGPADMGKGLPNPPGWYEAAVGAPTKQKVIYLTLDDGPSRYTPALVTALKKHDAAATFFVSGGTSTMYKPLLRKMQRNGNAVGNHTWSHAQLSRVSTATARDQILRPRRELGSLLDSCMRPPYGLINEKVAKIAIGAGFQPVMWTAHIEDWRPHSFEWTVQRLRASTRPGAVILGHDTHAQTVKAVTRMLPVWKKMGYTLRPVPSCVTSGA